MPPALGAVRLTWNGARLLALVLNALYGLEEYYDSHFKDLDLDGLFGLRVIHGQLQRLYVDFDGRGLDPEILEALQNLSRRADFVANRAVLFVSQRDAKYFNQFHYLAMHPYDVVRPSQRTDERLRWVEKERPGGKDHRGGHALWFSEKQSDRCFAEVLSKDYIISNGTSVCTISDDCLRRMFGTRGLTGYRLVHQILFAAVVQLAPCADAASAFLRTTRDQSLGDFTKEFCTNMIEELLSFQKNARGLARLNNYQRDLLMEQVFACGQFGFVETASLHLLVSVLSWQHPTLGCFANQNAAEDSSFGVLQADPTPRQVFPPRRILNDVIHSDGCSTHSATVAAGALCVFLRFILSPGPWPEFALSEQPVTVQYIAAEDHFKQFKYSRWVHDSAPVAYRLSRPPRVAWSPDLLAYVLLLGFFFFASFCTQFCCKRRTKQMYHFAYKKL